MTPPTRALIVIGVALVVFLLFFFWCRHVLEGPTAPIVVVDRRTMRLANKRIAQAINAGDAQRAYYGLTALILWLSAEIRVGPRRYRLEYAAALETAELRKRQLAAAAGLSGYTAR